MQGLIAYLFGLWNGLVALIGNVITWTFDFLSAMIDYVFSLLLWALPESWRDYWDGAQVQLEALFGWLDTISYFVPIYGMLTFILGVYSAIASIRLGRWMLALIPRAFTGVS